MYFAAFQIYRTSLRYGRFGHRNKTVGNAPSLTYRRRYFSRSLLPARPSRFSSFRKYSWETVHCFASIASIDYARSTMFQRRAALLVASNAVYLISGFDFQIRRH